MGYACDSGDGNAASVLIMVLDTGDSLAACANHVADYMSQMAQAMGVELSHPGTITLEQLVEYATHRDGEIDTIKGSGPVLAARHAELQTVMESLATIIGGAQNAQDGQTGDSAQWSDPNAIEAATEGLGATEVADGTSGPVVDTRPDADDPAPY